MSEDQKLQFSAAIEGTRIVFGVSMDVGENGLTRLKSLAASDGRSIPDWIQWYLGDLGVDIGDLSSDIANWLAFDRAAFAAELLTNAWGETSPWYPGFRQAPSYPATEDEFLTTLREWAQPEKDADGFENVTQADADRMLASGMAALAGDGAETYRLAHEVQTEWWYSDDEEPTAAEKDEK